MNYGNEVANLLITLQDKISPEEKKAMAEKRLREIRFIVTKQQYNVADDRVDDVIDLEDLIASPATPAYHKVKARQTIKKIVNESPAVHSMRKRLIKEMQSGNSENVRDINEFVLKHPKFQ